MNLPAVKNVSFTGTRSYDRNNKQNLELMRQVAVAVMTNNDIEKVSFGGAIGVDTEMLVYCGVIKDEFSSECNGATLVAVLPDTLEALRDERARWAVETYADIVIELKKKITPDDGYKSFHNRNQALVDACDVLIGMPKDDLNPRSGTKSCMNRGYKAGKQVLCVPLV